MYISKFVNDYISYSFYYTLFLMSSFGMSYCQPRWPDETVLTDNSVNTLWKRLQAVGEFQQNMLTQSNKNLLCAYMFRFKEIMAR